MSRLKSGLARCVLHRASLTLPGSRATPWQSSQERHEHLLTHFPELITGLIYGFWHAFESDHLTAITHFVSMDPRPCRAAIFGFRWGIGHTITVFLISSIVILLQIQLKEGGFWERGAEVTVGVSLIGLGVWRLILLSRRPHRHAHSHGGLVHEHQHTHEPGSGHVHRHAPTFTGLLHGAAGTAGVLAIVPVSVMPSKLLAFGYILLFCVGTTGGMAASGWCAGHLYQKTGALWKRGFAALVGLTAVAGMALGVVWIWNSVSGQ